MNKDKDFSLVDGRKHKTSKYPKLASQAGESQKKTRTDHLSRCMSQRNLPGTSTKEVKLIRRLSKCKQIRKKFWKKK